MKGCGRTNLRARCGAWVDDAVTPHRPHEPRLSNFRMNAACSVGLSGNISPYHSTYLRIASSVAMALTPANLRRSANRERQALPVRISQFRRLSSGNVLVVVHSGHFRAVTPTWPFRTASRSLGLPPAGLPAHPVHPCTLIAREPAGRGVDGPRQRTRASNFCHQKTVRIDFDS